MPVVMLAVVILSTVLFPPNWAWGDGHSREAVGIARASQLVLSGLAAVDLQRISITSGGSQANNSSFAPSLSADGRDRCSGGLGDDTAMACENIIEVP